MKLFGKGGKFNIIDVLLVVLVLAVVAFVFLAPSLNETDDGDLSDVESANAKNISFRVICEDASEALAQSILQTLDGPDAQIEGNTISPRQIYNNNKLVDARITDCQYIDGDLHFTIEGACTFSAGAYMVGTQGIRIGRDYVIKTLDIELGGVVYAVETK